MQVKTKRIKPKCWKDDKRKHKHRKHINGKKRQNFFNLIRTEIEKGKQAAQNYNTVYETQGGEKCENQ